MNELLKNELTLCAARCEERLRKFIEGKRTDPLHCPEESALLDAAEYSLLAGGKRIRPFLAMQFARLCGERAEAALDFAAALEMLHTYSLIHDDLPAMDDDDLRRGKPTCHKAFGEATAILAGDALLTECFGVIARAPLSPEAKCRAVALLSEKAGMLGMVGGQEIDLKSEGKDIRSQLLFTLQRKKTGALIEAASLLGCIAAGVYGGEKFEAARKYAAAFGLAFQITDDILDVVGSTDELGKGAGRDEKDNKSTMVTVFGFEGAKEEAKKQIEAAKEALSVFPEKEAEPLLLLADYLAERKN